MLLIIKGASAFFGVMMIIRLILHPGFAQLYFEGRNKGKPILRNNIVLTVICWLIFYVMGVCGINILN